MTRSRLTTLTLLSFTFGALASLATANGNPVLRLHAFAVDLGSTTTPRARAGTLDIVIERWSTPEDVAKLHSVLAEKGADALLSALQGIKPRTGYIRSSTSLGWDIHFAQQIKAADGSQRIVIATDRPMSFWEAVNKPRSADYAFTLAEVRLRPDGTGEGKLVPAAKIDFDKETSTLEVENYSSEPVRLTEVKIEK